MQARYYDPVIGRFMSNDPVGYTAKNPVMSFNRYLYVNNNPYKYTDPDGKLLFMLFWGPSIVTASMDIVIGVGLYTAGKSLNGYMAEAESVQNQYIDMNESIKKGDYKNAFKQKAQVNQSFKKLTETALETAETVASNILGNTTSGLTPLTKTDQAITVGVALTGAITKPTKEKKETSKPRTTGVPVIVMPSRFERARDRANR